MRFRYDSRMELRQLRYFVGVAHEHSVTRAAARLHVAQPALSRQIHQLEAEVGVKLLARSSKGVELTPAGEAFLSEAEAILRQSEQAVRSAQRHELVQRGQLNVGYVWGLFHTLVPQWVACFRQQHPEVAINLFDLTATGLAEALQAGKLDLGFIGFAYEADSVGLEKRKVAACDFLAALPAKHAAARQRRVKLASLKDEFFIAISALTYPGAAQVLNDACHAAGFRPKILQTAERGFTLLGLVAAECGVTLLPSALQALPHPGVVFRPLSPVPVADLFVAWNRQPLSPLARQFVDALPAPRK